MSDIDTLRERTVDLFRRCQRAAYLSIDIRVLGEGIERIEQLRAEVEKARQHAVSRKQEDEANLCLSLVLTFGAAHSELSMWLAFKKDDAEAAWGDLVAAQVRAAAAMRAHRRSLNLEAYIEKLLDLENRLFPPQTFLSVGCIATSIKCSICLSEYGECDHVVGRAYMGELCAEVLMEASHIDEVSIVDNPVDKRCRTYFQVEGGEKRDLLTWALLPPDKDEPSSGFDPKYFIRCGAYILHGDSPGGIAGT